MSAAVYPSVAIQTHLTFTARRWGQFPTISFTNGATAGSEVVTVADDLSSVTVQIASGTTTMLQIKTAIDAATSLNNLGAGDLLSVAIAGGHNSDVVYTCKSATLAGGAVAAKASKTIGHLVYTAKATGTGGNSTRIRYTSGATLTITVSTADITVRLRSDGTTTNAQIKAAIAADSAANALVDLASDGLSLSFKPFTNAAPAFTALTGGVTALAASVVVQDLTIAADATGVAANGATFTYTTGATAGAEVVTVVGSAINVQIQNGVSTATQIETALNAASAFTSVYNVTVSGTGATAQKTVNGATLTGATAATQPASPNEPPVRVKVIS